MTRRFKHWALLILLMLSTMRLSGDLSTAIIQTMDPGDPVHFTGTGEIDVPVLRMNGVIVGTVAPVLFVVRANQALGVSTVIQHADRNDVIEHVQISSTGGALTSTASPLRIAASTKNGQIIVLQGTSASATYTIPDGNGVKWRTSGSVLFTDRTSKMLRYDTGLSLWREISTLDILTRADMPAGWGLVMTHATDCPGNTPTGQLNDICRDLDDGREWRCTLTSCTVAGNWTLVTPGVITMAQQATDVTPPAASQWAIYPKSTGLFIRDSAGNITGPLGTGGGGGGTVTTEKLPVQAATTGNVTISNPGTAVFDGVTLTTGQRLLVRAQSTGSQNGIYLFATSSTAMTRSADADSSGEFIDSFAVKVQSGTLYGGVTFYFSNTGAFTLGTTTPTFNVQSWGEKAELLANRNTASGYPSLTSEVKQIWTQRGDADTHAVVAAAGQITPTASTMRVAGSGGPVTMTSGDPRITGCTTAAMDGVELELEGDHATNTLTMPTGQGVLLCGNTGSVTFGLNSGRARFVCNFATTTWRQQDCPSLQTATNTSKALTGGTADINGLTSAANGLRAGDITGGNYCIEYGNTRECYCSGVLCTQQNLTNPVFVMSGTKPTCDVSHRSQRWDTLGGAGVTDIPEICSKDANDVYAWRATGTKTTTIPLRLDTVNFADANAFLSPQDRTNYDTMVTQFEDNVTACTNYKTYLPPNLASSPLWNVIVTHSALSGAGGSVVLTLAAKTFATGSAKDASFTSLTLPSSGVVAVNTSANLTTTTLGATNFDGTISLAANQLLRLTLCRTGGSGSDTLGVAWLLESISLRIDTN